MVKQSHIVWIVVQRFRRKVEYWRLLIIHRIIAPLFILPFRTCTTFPSSFERCHFDSVMFSCYKKMSS